MSLIQKNNIKNIVDLENFLIKVDHENIIANNGDIVYHEKFKYNHTFADGIYVREMTIDKDEVIIGAIHKRLHVWFLLSGHITVLTEDGISEYEAPSTVLSKPGIKKVIYGNKRSVFTNVHKNPTNTKDIKKLEKEIVALSYEEYEKYVNEK